MHILKTALVAALIGGGAVAQAAQRAEPVNPKGEAKLAKALEGRVAGKPVDCLQLRSIQSSRIYDGTAIVYDVGSTLYVNRPAIGASSLSWDPVLVTDTHSSQLCSIDTVKLIDRNGHFYRGFVGLGEFVPYRRADRVRAD